MNALKQREQILGSVRGFGNGIERSLHRFGLFAFGDVTRDPDPQLVGRRPARRPHNVDHSPILADIAILEMQLELAGHDLVYRLPGPVPVFRHHHVEHALADHFLRRVSENALARSTGKDDMSVGIDGEDGEDGIHHELNEAGKLRGGFNFHGEIIVH